MCIRSQWQCVHDSCIRSQWQWTQYVDLDETGFNNAVRTVTSNLIQTVVSIIVQFMQSHALRTWVGSQQCMCHAWCTIIDILCVEVLNVCLFVGSNVLHTLCMYVSRKTSITPEYRKYSPLFDRNSSLTPTSPVLISWGIRLSNNLSWDGLTHRVMQASGLSGHVATVTWFWSVAGPGPQSGHVNIRVSQQSSRCQAGPRDIRPSCPISPNELLIINIAHIILVCVVLS